MMKLADEDGNQQRRAALKDALAFNQTIVDTVREPLLVLDSNLRVTMASRAFYRTFGVSPEDTLENHIYDLGNGQWNIPALRTLLEEVLPKHKAFDDFQVVHEFPSLGRRVMLLNARRLWRETNNTEHILLAIEDVTERQRIADELVRSNEDLQRFVCRGTRPPLTAQLRPESPSAPCKAD
jgi:PAS domain S-box-containing protein